MANTMVDALEDIEADIEELVEFISMYTAGVKMPTALVKVLQSSIGLFELDGEEAAAELKARMPQAVKAAERAQKHIDNGFMYLFSVATVRLWSALEATITDVCRARLQHENYWKQTPALKGVRVELDEFLALDEDRQIDHVFEAITSNSKAKFQPGAGRFENVLKALELGGDLPAPVKKRLVWLSEARHCLVHRQGKVDEKFLKHNPDAGHIAGDKLIVREHEFARSLAAVRAYAAIVGTRLEDKGLDKRRPHRHKLLARMLKKMAANDLTLKGIKA